MRRRQFITLLGGAAAWPLIASAQSPRNIPTVGVLWHAANAEGEGAYYKGLVEGFNSLGYVHGQTIRLEHRFPNEDPVRFKAMAAELVAMKVDVLVSVGAATTDFVKAATTTIPVVFAFVTDPVASRLVDSLARPGRNMTGVSNTQVDLDGKRLELLKELFPAMTDLGLLINPNEPASRVHLTESTAAAAKLGLKLHTFEARSPAELEQAFDAMAKARVQAVNIGSGGSYFAWREIIGKLALAHKIPLGGWSRETLEAGAVMSYGSDQVATIKLAVGYVDRILKGAKPADMPVELPTRYQMLINLRTARALGVSVPPALMARADEVIE